MPPARTVRTTGSGWPWREAVRQLTENLSRLRRGYPRLPDPLPDPLPGPLSAVLVALPPAIRPEPGWQPVWVQAGLYIALVLALVWRRRRPVLVAALATTRFRVQYLGQVRGQERDGDLALFTFTVRGLRMGAATTVICVAGCVVLWIPAWQRDYGGPERPRAWLAPLAVGRLPDGLGVRRVRPCPARLHRRVRVAGRAWRVGAPRSGRGRRRRGAGAHRPGDPRCPVRLSAGANAAGRGGRWRCRKNVAGHQVRQFLRHPERVTHSWLAQLKTKGPGDWAALDVQVTVMPKMTIFSEPL